MTYPPHALVQFGGTLSQLTGAAEAWTCGVRVTKGVVGGGGGYLDSPQAYSDALAPGLNSWFANSSNGMSPGATLNFLKVNNIGPDGKYVDPVTHQSTVLALGGAVQKAPAFCSVCLTLESNVSRGHAHRGRIYLPNYTYNAQGSQIATADVTAVLAAGKALISLLQSPTGAGGIITTPSIVSKLGAGTIRAIDHLSVDNIYDYQGRRKDRVVATRKTGPAF